MTTSTIDFGTRIQTDNITPTRTAYSEIAAQNTTTATVAPANAAAPAASIHRRLLLTWLAVYPTITIVQMLLGTSLAQYALPIRTLIVTALVAPVVVYLALPQILKVDRRIARAWAGRRGTR